jgi:hypothetical protein
MIGGNSHRLLLFRRPSIGNYGLKANQTTTAMTTSMTKNHTTGVTRFELPLRGESLAA